MPRSIFAAEMTNLEVQEYLDRERTSRPSRSARPRPATRPLWTDVYIPMEVAKRAAPELDALVGPPVPFGIAHDHRGAAGVVRPPRYLREHTARRLPVALGRRLRADRAPERPLLQLHAMEFAVAQFFDELPDGVRVYPFPYWAE